MARKDPLSEAIAKASADKPAASARKVKPMSKRGRPQFDTSAVSARIWTPTELADEIGYDRTTIYGWEKQGLARDVTGKGFTMASVIAFIAGRERAAGRAEADPDDVLEAEKLRDLRARADMREDERDLQRKKLIEAELAIAIYDDDTAHVTSHLLGMGARLMQTLAAETDAETICAIIRWIVPIVMGALLAAVGFRVIEGKTPVTPAVMSVPNQQRPSDMTPSPSS